MPQDLTPQQRHLLATELQGTHPQNNPVLEQVDRAFSEHPRCPHCQHEQVTKLGRVKIFDGISLGIPHFRIGFPSNVGVAFFTDTRRGLPENDRRGGLRYAKVSCRIQRVCDPDRSQPDILYGTDSYTFPWRAGKSGLHRLHRDGCARPLPVSLLLNKSFPLLRVYSGRSARDVCLFKRFSLPIAPGVCAGKRKSLLEVRRDAIRFSGSSPKSAVNFFPRRDP